MKILMLGWEYPPKISGGLGVASQGLAEGLSDLGHQVLFLLPKKSPRQTSQKVKLINAAALKPNIAFWKKTVKQTEITEEIELGTMLLPYLPPEVFIKARKTQTTVTESTVDTPESVVLSTVPLTGEYHGNLGAELMKYALLAVQVAKKERPDVIHAHDWITFRAGVLIKQLTGIPLYVHLHSTEHDRNGIYAQDFAIQEESKGLAAADGVFCVSESLKQTVITQYAVSPEKIRVVPNAISVIPDLTERPVNKKRDRIAFIGRLTHQKSPSTFIDLARDLTSRGYDFHYFVMGDGYLRSDLEGRVNASNFASRFTFTGFLERDALLKKLDEMDLLVVPSASEPFGLVAVEAILHGIPVAAARGIGAAEFIPDLPQVDRWDQFSYVRLIERLMTENSFRESVVKNCLTQARSLSWEKSARLVAMAYGDR